MATVQCKFGASGGEHAGLEMVTLFSILHSSSNVFFLGNIKIIPAFPLMFCVSRQKQKSTDI